MTSGVKQALPQMLSPKTPPDGKMPRGRAGGPEFAEALGGFLGKTNGNGPSNATVPTPGSALRTAWPGFAKGPESEMAENQAGPASNRASRVSVSERAVQMPAKDDGETPDDSASLTDGTSVATPSMQVAARERVGTPNETRTTEEPETASALKHDNAQVPAHAASANAAVPIAPAIAHSAGPDSVELPLRRAPTRTADDQTGKDAATRPQEDRPRIAGFVPMGRARQDETIRFEPVAAAIEVTPSSSRGAKSEPMTDAAPDRTKAAARVTVVGQQNIPAPATSTALVLVDSIASSEILETGAPKISFETLQPSAHMSAQSLKLQLHPAELGMVTATLRFAGEQLSIELKVENQEAYRQLAADSDTIVNSLRDLGYDVDRVTVLQPSSTATGVQRADAGPVTTQQGRSAEQFGQGSPNGGNASSGGQSSSGEGSNAGRGGRQNAATQQKENAGGVYI
ncbi:MAG: flagellar hook-length control protein FliK [Rhizobiaceae bacterium]|nr:flagellar hook-length control protein FliK [Rhizobiaceae bacterium]